MNKKTQHTCCIAVAMSLILATTIMPVVRATESNFEQGEIDLDIDLSPINVIVKDNWQQIKNAAIVQLVAQKMQRCVDGGQALSLDGPGGVTEKRPRTANWFEDIFTSGVLDDGQIFFDTAWALKNKVAAVAVGPWMESHFDGGFDDGKIYCNETNGRIFSMFVYIMEKYVSGQDQETASLNLQSSVSDTERLKYVCNGKDPGILVGLKGNAIQTVFSANVAEDCQTVSWFIGNYIDNQLTYLQLKYNEFLQKNSHNSYLVQWDKLGTYNGIVGYYLYSQDFDVQCDGTFKEDLNGQHKYVVDKKDDPDYGMVKIGDWQYSKNTSATSFVGANSDGSARELTCKGLIQEMDDHIDEYVRFINSEILGECQKKVDEAIATQTGLLEEKRNASWITDEKLEAINNIEADYEEVQKTGAYVAKRRTQQQIDDGVAEEVITDGPYKSPMKDPFANENAKDVPTGFIWTCREHLPYINVAVEYEADLESEIDNQFQPDHCKNVLELGWLFCPIIHGVSDAIDSLQSWIEEIFF